MRAELRLAGLSSLPCAHRIEQAHRTLSGVERAGYRAERVERAAGRAVSPESAPAAAIRATGFGDAAPRGRGFEYDLLIVGTGGAGTAAAIRSSELGARVAIAEGADVVGGTCVNVGCISSKFLIEAAHHFHTARTAFPGIESCDPWLAWAEVQRRKRQIVETLRQEKYVDVLTSYEGITLLRGRAQLLGGGRVQVGEQEVKARKVILATGTRPALPPILGLQETTPLDSTTLMEVEALPESLTIIGGGSIGLELGQAFSRFGVKVTVLEAMERILPTEDPEISGKLEAALAAEGIELHTRVKVTRVSRADAGYTIHGEGGSLPGEIRAEQLLVATGRRPNTDDLGLEAAGVATDSNGFIQVDELMRTSNPEVFAAGDVTGGPGFVYVAAMGGAVAARAALAELSGEDPIPLDLSATPSVTFTDPQVAAVGMTEAEARAAGLSPKVTSLAVEHLPRASVSGRARGADVHEGRGGPLLLCVNDAHGKETNTMAQPILPRDRSRATNRMPAPTGIFAFSSPMRTSPSAVRWPSERDLGENLRGRCSSSLCGQRRPQDPGHFHLRRYPSTQTRCRPHFPARVVS